MEVRTTARWLSATLFASGAVAAVAIVGAPCALAQETISTGQMHLRVGQVSASYSGPANGSNSVPTSIDYELELFTSNRSSYTLHSTIAYDSGSARVNYAYGGFSKRWYLSHNGMSFESTDGVQTVTIMPRTRYFAGIDLGVSQVLVGSLGNVLETRSALLEYGGHAGVLYQVSKVTALEGVFGYGRGAGFSSVSVSASIMRILFGVSIFF